MFYLSIKQLSSLSSVAGSESLFCQGTRPVSQRAAVLFLLKSVQPRLGGFKYFDTGFFNLNRLVYVLASAEGIIQEESLCPNCMCFLSRQPGTGIFPNCTQGSCVAKEKPRPYSAPYLHQLVCLRFISLEVLIVLRYLLKIIFLSDPSLIIHCMASINSLSFSLSLSFSASLPLVSVICCVSVSSWLKAGGGVSMCFPFALDSNGRN